MNFVLVVETACHSRFDFATATAHHTMGTTRTTTSKPKRVRNYRLTNKRMLQRKIALGLLTPWEKISSVNEIIENVIIEGIRETRSPPSPPQPLRGQNWSGIPVQLPDGTWAELPGEIQNIDIDGVLIPFGLPPAWTYDKQRVIEELYFNKMESLKENISDTQQIYF